MRCYNFDTVLAAFDNFGTLVDTVAAGGNGNTYKLECTETTNQANYMNPCQNQEKLKKFEIIQSLNWQDEVLKKVSGYQ